MPCHYKLLAAHFKLFFVYLQINHVYYVQLYFSGLVTIPNKQKCRKAFETLLKIHQTSYHCTGNVIQELVRSLKLVL